MIPLNVSSNFSFLRGASHPYELIERAVELEHPAIALTDECSLAGIVKAHMAAKESNIKLIIGSRFTLSNNCKLIAIAPSKEAYAELSGFITLTRRRSEKGCYEAHFNDLQFRLQNCLIILLLDKNTTDDHIAKFCKAFKHRLWLGIGHHFHGPEQSLFKNWQYFANKHACQLIAAGEILMHCKSRKALQDTLTAIHHNTAIHQLGTLLESNAESYLRNLKDYTLFYPQNLIEQTYRLSELCHFNLDELRYQYPEELIPENKTPIEHLKNLVREGKNTRWPKGTPQFVEDILQKELELIEELKYEYYFLTVHDIVRFARSQNILCQGRGSAVNSVVCYCLFITEIAPGQINVLFERFISKERDEPPDIDVDFEHQRREEVIQYIYHKYSRERAALAATVITYRSRSAIRDVGKALGLDAALIDHFAKNLAWWDRRKDLQKTLNSQPLSTDNQKLKLFYQLVQEILGFPRHLSQHVGGFVITHEKVSHLVPIENASMPDRTIIQWDKEDLEAMRLLKVDVLALGMLTALRKSLDYIQSYNPNIKSLADIPIEDPLTYDMICKADTVGVFQIESRAQMSMLPRLRPRTFYDLVIEIAIIRPGPIQGDMVHPYLRRRHGKEKVSYPSQAIASVLQPTLGVPIFQEQVIRLAMIAAGFTGGEADQLRRAMASWGKNGRLLQFEEKFIQGMLHNGYTIDFATRLFEQVKGFGGYGFPESHSASFALLCYASCWIKRHHTAAFYCALLNSQPMGFYSPSQLVQDARRHNIRIYPVDINISHVENRLESTGLKKNAWGIRLGFIRVRSLELDIAEKIVACRAEKPFTNMQDLVERTTLSAADLEKLAAADAFLNLAGNRHQAYWAASAAHVQPALFKQKHDVIQHDLLLTPPPCEVKDIHDDYHTLGLTLRRHPMTILRDENPFKRCKKQNELHTLSNGRFVQVAGLVTGRQRPGTAKGTLFLTLEDETGNTNVVVWKATQNLYRPALLTSKLMLVKGRVEISIEPGAHPVVHVIAGQLLDYSHKLAELNISSRDFH